MVHFVGAGPGAPDLITVRGKSHLEKADVIVYAGSLVNPELLAYAKPDAVIHNSAKMTLEEVVAVLAEAEQSGKFAVRLHTGDPSLYGAIREQIDALSALGIESDVTPGVSSLFGATAALKAELTLPGVSQTVILSRVAGRTEVPERESLEALAKIGATLVLFLSVNRAEEVKRALLSGGYRPETPCAIVYKATWTDEKVVRGTIERLPELVEENHLTKTTLILVGDALGETYERSKLYDGSFATGYRAAKPENTDDV